MTSSHLVIDMNLRRQPYSAGAARKDVVCNTAGPVIYTAVMLATAYARISQILRRQIKNGVWQPDDLIPAESRLAQEHGVSVGTAPCAGNGWSEKNLRINQ